jgi:DNA-binding LytR/AlgR family response regulator
MERPKNIPEYFISKRNIYVQIVFTTVFAYAFINIYEPFGAAHWYAITKWQFLLYSGLLVLLGMAVVVVSRVIMYQINKVRPVSILQYSFMVAGEIILMAAFFASIEDFALDDSRSYAELWFIAIQNTALILLIPYLISLLYFAFQEKKIKLENLTFDYFRKPVIDFIPFRDENGVMRLSLKKSDLLFLEASENYVLVHYRVRNEIKQYLLRNSLKKLENEMKLHHILRCHRSYMVNIGQVKLMQKGKKGLELHLSGPENVVILVSKTYEPAIIAELDLLPSASQSV